MTQGWVASPDGRTVLLGVRASAGPAEDWYQVDAASGVLRATASRPTGDTPLSWTADGHIIWWRLAVGGAHARVVRSDIDGTHDRVPYDVTVPTDRIVYAWYTAIP